VPRHPSGRKISVPVSDALFAAPCILSPPNFFPFVPWASLLPVFFGLVPPGLHLSVRPARSYLLFFLNFHSLASPLTYVAVHILLVPLPFAVTSPLFNPPLPRSWSPHLKGELTPPQHKKFPSPLVSFIPHRTFVVATWSPLIPVRLSRGCQHTTPVISPRFPACLVVIQYHLCSPLLPHGFCFGRYPAIIQSFSTL